MSKKEKVYIEFSIEGLLDVSNGERDYVIEEIRNILNSAFPSHLISRLQFHTSVVSESDIAYALYLSGRHDSEIN